MSIASTIDELIRSASPRRHLVAAHTPSSVSREACDLFSPELSYGRHAGPAPATARAAAVVALLFRRNGRWHLPLTVRPETLANHGGQVCLPGGAIGPHEHPCDAALRELREELGVCEGVALLGHLSECYVFASDFNVTPWLAAIDSEPTWQPQQHEVAQVVELPLERLFDESVAPRFTIERGPLVFHAPYLRFDEANIWGATSVILAELAAVLKNYTTT